MISLFLVGVPGVLSGSLEFLAEERDVGCLSYLRAANFEKAFARPLFKEVNSLSVVSKPSNCEGREEMPSGSLVISMRRRKISIGAVNFKKNLVIGANRIVEIAVWREGSAWFT